MIMIFLMQYASDKTSIKAEKEKKLIKCNLFENA